MNEIAGIPGCAQKGGVSAPAESGLERKTFTQRNKFIHSLQHEPAGADGGTIRGKRGKPLSDHVRVDKLPALGLRREEAPGVGGLSHAIRSGEDVDVRWIEAHPDSLKQGGLAVCSSNDKAESQIPARPRPVH